MSTIKNNIPIILMLLFEIAVGVLLLINPETFTTIVVISFGAFLTVVGIIYLIRYFAARKREEESTFTLIWSIVLLAFGIFAISAHSLIMSFFAFIAILYGVILLISGFVKIIGYFNSRKANLPVSAFSIISAVVSVILGGVILVNPFETTHFLFIFAGIAILVSAAFDIITLIFVARAGKRAIDDGYAEATVMDVEYNSEDYR